MILEKKECVERVMIPGFIERKAYDKEVMQLMRELQVDQDY